MSQADREHLGRDHALSSQVPQPVYALPCCFNPYPNLFTKNHKPELGFHELALWRYWQIEFLFEIEIRHCVRVFFVFSIVTVGG